MQDGKVCWGVGALGDCVGKVRWDGGEGALGIVRKVRWEGALAAPGCVGGCVVRCLGRARGAGALGVALTTQKKVFLSLLRSRCSSGPHEPTR